MKEKFKETQKEQRVGKTRSYASDNDFILHPRVNSHDSCFFYPEKKKKNATDETTKALGSPE